MACHPACHLLTFHPGRGAPKATGAAGPWARALTSRKGRVRGPPLQGPVGAVCLRLRPRLPPAPRGPARLHDEAVVSRRTCSSWEPAGRCWRAAWAAAVAATWPWARLGGLSGLWVQGARAAAGPCHAVMLFPNPRMTHLPSVAGLLLGGPAAGRQHLRTRPMTRWRSQEVLPAEPPQGSSLGKSPVLPAVQPGSSGTPPGLGSGSGRAKRTVQR